MYPQKDEKLIFLRKDQLKYESLGTSFKFMLDGRSLADLEMNLASSQHSASPHP